MIKRFWNWVLDELEDFFTPYTPPKFQPGVFYNDDLKLTEIILEDTIVVIMRTVSLSV